jgi:hypothetical protein
MSNEAAVIVATPDGLVRYEIFGEFAEAEMGRAAAITEARRRERRNARARELRAQRRAGGRRLVLAALELALRNAPAGFRFAAASGESDFAWLKHQCEVVASGDAGSGSTAVRWELDLASCDATWSTGQAAGFLCVTPRAVVAAIERGDLEATRVGLRAWALREQDVRAYAARGRRAADAEPDSRPAAPVPHRPDRGRAPDADRPGRDRGRGHEGGQVRPGAA